MATHTFDFLDGEVTASFDKEGTVDPWKAAAKFVEILEAAGCSLSQEFAPGEQDKKDAPEYVIVDLAFDVPDLGRVWIGIECPSDDAISD